MPKVTPLAAVCDLCALKGAKIVLPVDDPEATWLHATAYHNVGHLTGWGIHPETSDAMATWTAENTTLIATYPPNEEE